MVPQNSHHSNHATFSLCPHSLLMTCCVLVQVLNDAVTETSTLLDSGSSASFISEDLAWGLRLPRLSCSFCDSGIACLISSSSLHSTTLFHVRSIHSPVNVFNVSAVIVPKVTCDLLLHPFPSDITWNRLSYLHLADPDFRTPGRIDLLLSVEPQVCPLHLRPVLARCYLVVLRVHPTLTKLQSTTQLYFLKMNFSGSFGRLRRNPCTMTCWLFRNVPSWITFSLISLVFPIDDLWCHCFANLDLVNPGLKHSISSCRLKGHCMQTSSFRSSEKSSMILDMQNLYSCLILTCHKNQFTIYPCTQYARRQAQPRKSEPYLMPLLNPHQASHSMIPY